MYNRYIPPPKNSAPIQGSQYVSTVAPPAPQPKKVVFGDDDFAVAQQPEVQKETEQISKTVSEEKPKKSKKQKLDDDAAEDSPRKRRKSDDKAEEGGESPKPKKEKRKKEKKKSVLEGAGEQDDADDNLRQRHKGVFEKVQKALQAPKDAEGDEMEGVEQAEPEPVYDLQPLPQPAPVLVDESQLTYETLPPWLANPIRVTAETNRAWPELGIAPESAKILETKGYKDAFAVQTAVLPLLLPNPDRQGDVVVAAPTGSGKTLSYVLPMVQDISQGLLTNISGLIVLPTRELVQQVQQTCEACASAFAVNGGRRVKIGTAMGSKAFKEEQAMIMTTEQRYDPEGYRRYMNPPLDDLGADGVGWDVYDMDSPKPVPLHVIEHVPKVDILICTPGRLVEHIEKTRGFTLDYVRWLIVDEADKLLAQDFQQWLTTVMPRLSTLVRPGARDFPSSNKSGVRKVILSATMTQDLSLLNGLKLSRPRLVVLEGAKAGEQTLPELLKESAIKIRDSSLKPLYLVDLLHHLGGVSLEDTAAAVETKPEAGSDSESSSDSDSSSDSEDASDSSSSSSSESDSDSDSPPPKSKSKQPKLETKAKTNGTTTTPTTRFNTTVLIFTKSNEATLRLSRLLAILSPNLLGPLIGTLTSQQKTSKRAWTLRAFSQGKLRILVASDLVSRGIDLANLDNVINYDLPMNETSYVHRVGRTARAGREGRAWTLLEHAEGRRFWRDFAGEGKGAVTSIGRPSGRAVERFYLHGKKSDEEKKPEFAEERVKAYEAALEQLRREASGKK